MMLICIKLHLGNIWSSIHEKVKQYWGWVDMNLAYEKSVYLEIAVKKKVFINAEVAEITSKVKQGIACTSLSVRN